MYVSRVVLQGIKGFTDCELDFEGDNGHPGWAVVTGDNSAGKTALLRSIALAILGPDQLRTLAPDLSGWVTHGHEKGTISVEIQPNHELDRTYRGGYPVQGTFWAELEIVDAGGTWRAQATDVYRKKRKSAVNGPWQESTSGWFTLGYGPFRRLTGSSPDAQRLMVLPGRIPRFATLFKEDATLAEGEEWLKQLQYRSLEDRPDDQKTLTTFLDFAGDSFLRQSVKIDRVDSYGVWLRDSANRVIPLSDMSEGYRSALAMLIDIFRHMVAAYGTDGLVEESDGRRRVVRPGVVLIDEIDAHLHPEWQREIGFWLKEHFPLVQFIVTTHSPIVCQAADGGRIYHIPADRENLGPFRLSPDDVRRIVAGKPDEILVSPAFGLPHTRSPRAVEGRQRHGSLLAKKRTIGNLTPEENAEFEQLTLFLFDGEA